MKRCAALACLAVVLIQPGRALDVNPYLPLVYSPSSGLWEGWGYSSYESELAPYTNATWGSSSAMIPVAGYYQKVRRTNIWVSCSVTYTSIYTDRVFNLGVWDPADGKWYICSSVSPPVPVRTWGTSSMFPVPGDYDGDDLNDLAVFEPSTARWYIWYSGNNKQTNIQWGWSGAVPVPGDYTSDGRTDLAVYDTATGNWYIRRSQNGAMLVIQWGFAGAVPVPYGDPFAHAKNVAVVYQASGTWYINKANSATPSSSQYEIISFGPAGATAVPARFDYAGVIACYARSSGVWFLHRGTRNTHLALTGSATAYPAWPQYWINRRYGLQD